MVSRAHDAEVIVVGGGHNGLICAAYLARAGIDTLLLEARPTVGGCASTVEMWDARFNICNCDHTMIRALPVIDELELTAHGLEYLEADTGQISVFHDGSPAWVHFDDIDQTIEGLRQSYPRSADGYRRYVRDAIPVARLIIEMAQTRASTTTMVARAARNGGRGGARLIRWSRSSLSDVLGHYFPDWQMVMPATSSGPTVWGVPPDLPGTGLAAAIYASRHLIKTGRPVGGSGALTDSIAASHLHAGGRIRCDARVRSLVIDGDTITGVSLTDGTTLTADAVVAAYDPHRVLLDWLDNTPPRARKLVDRYRSRPVIDGYESKVDAILGNRPRYKAFGPLQERHPELELMGATVVVCPTIDDLAEAHERRPAGGVADRPTMLVNVPSVLDPSVAPSSSQHVLSLEALFTPYALRGGWPNSDEPQRWIDQWGALLEPGSLEIEKWRVMTPDRYEQEFSLHRGHTPSYSGSPLAALLGRNKETTRYRSPIDGLYFTGAGTFPGAGVFGASGRNAAEVVRRDRRRARRG